VLLLFVFKLGLLGGALAMSIPIALVDGMPVESGLIAADPTAPILYQFDNETGALFVKTLPSP